MLKEELIPTPRLRAAALTRRFHEMFGDHPTLFRTPGRVNLIGEHTDYNEGFVMPAAIDFYTWVAGAKREDRVLEIYSEHFEEKISLRLDALEGPPRGHWSDYARGVAAVLETAGHKLSGANLIVDGNVPLGAGLSSSASIELACALALSTLSEIDVSRLELVRLCQKAEHKFAGALCGIMDQFIAAFGIAEHALMLDCRSLEYQPLPILADIRIVVCNSMVRHELANGEYNRRRGDCETAVKLLQRHLPKISALRDVEIKQLEMCKDVLPPIVYRRCHHVVTENQRVLEATQALRYGDAQRFGQLMYGSHASLRDDYEVSCKELDLLVNLASGIDGVFGARMTGGGFGGCTVNLAKAEAATSFKAHIERAYLDATGISPDVYICQPAQGAEIWLDADDKEKVSA